MMVFMSLVLVLIGQFCCDVIGRQNMKVVKFAENSPSIIHRFSL